MVRRRRPRKIHRKGVPEAASAKALPGVVDVGERVRKESWERRLKRWMDGLAGHGNGDGLFYLLLSR